MMKCMYGNLTSNSGMITDCDEYCKGFIPESEKYLRKLGFVCYRQIHSTDNKSLI